MALDGKILARAREQIGHTHANNVAEHYLRQEKIYSQIPEIHRIDDRLRAQMSELVGLTIKRSADLSDALKALEDESLALQAKKAELLHAADALMQAVRSCEGRSHRDLPAFTNAVRKLTDKIKR